MADFDNTQNGPAGPILADDLMRDRSRQFTEFLDDQVSLTPGRPGRGRQLTQMIYRPKPSTIIESQSSGCWTLSKCD